eukprot:scaffold52790_cov15-Prasinocladus_malaysianus.AAC.1
MNDPTSLESAQYKRHHGRHVDLTNMLIRVSHLTLNSHQGGQSELMFEIDKGRQMLKLSMADA